MEAPSTLSSSSLSLLVHSLTALLHQVALFISLPSHLTLPLLSTPVLSIPATLEVQVVESIRKRYFLYPTAPSLNATHSLLPPRLKEEEECILHPSSLS